MNITLAIVRQTLKEALGFDSFTASFITAVHDNSERSTACINAHGRLEYNPAFVKTHVTCKEDLFSLIFHELLHPMFNHFIYDNGPIENLAADAVINAAISTLYSAQSRNGQLFRKLYKQRGIEGLLRPLSLLYNSRLERVYGALYEQRSHEDKLTTGELITTLKILLEPQDAAPVALIGSHTHDTVGGWSQDTLERLAGDIKHSTAQQHGNSAGYSANLLDMFMESLRTHLAVKRVLLQRFTTTRKIDRFKELLRERRTCTSPVPIHPSKRDLVLITAGFHPGFFHNQLSTPAQRYKGLAIYLDVSGSVNQYLPKILGVLQHLRREITSVFMFSNRVYEVPFEALLKGNIKTTYGTDFDCIAASILEHNLDKAVIITDGQACMGQDNKQRLKRRGLITLTILFDKAHTCPGFEAFGDVVLLDDACH